MCLIVRLTLLRRTVFGTAFIFLNINKCLYLNIII
jgi:hypothetical protein